MKRKVLIGLLAVVLFTALLFVFRQPLLRACATHLIHNDVLQHADAMAILSGGGYDRGNEAVRVYKQGYAPRIICPGGNLVIELRVFDMDTLESDMTVANLKRQGIDTSAIIQLKYGTSTREEADTLLNYCRQQNIKKLIIVSSLIHTGRVDKVFRKQFADAGIQIIVHGAPSSRYNEMLWWQSENGLIAINNEWIKEMYYWWKY